MLIALAVITAVEAGALVAMTVLRQRNRQQVALLQHELESDADRGWIPRGRDAVKTAWETAAGRTAT